jgi:transcriptional regulator with XRE-family HTH domain
MQCRAARALLDWTPPDLAEASGRSLTTVVDYESGRRRVSTEAADRMRAALEAAGIEFTNGKRPGVRMNKG